MSRLLGLRSSWMFILFVIVDIISIGMGMGVPIFCILFGFFIGWFSVKLITTSNTDVPKIFSKVLKYAIVTSGFTLIAMLVLWAPFAANLFDPTKDLANTGIPMILFEPLASFIGWIVLMVIISPFLQLLTTLFSAYLTLLDWMTKAAHDQKAV